MPPASPSLDDRLDEAAAAQDPRAAVSFVLRETYDAARARAASVYKTQKFSDHAPLTVEYAAA